MHPAIVLARDAADQDGFLQPREIVELERTRSSAAIALAFVALVALFVGRFWPR